MTDNPIVQTLTSPELFSLDVLRNYLLVGAVLFCLGMLGFLTRRNLIVMFLSIELMLQGTMLGLIALGRYHGTWTGQIFTIVILTVAACEASIALALVVILYNRRSSLDVTLWNEIHEADLPEVETSESTAEPVAAAPGPESYPRLITAGLEPEHAAAQAIERRT